MICNPLLNEMLRLSADAFGRPLFVCEYTLYAYHPEKSGEKCKSFHFFALSDKINRGKILNGVPALIKRENLRQKGSLKRFRTSRKG